MIKNLKTKYKIHKLIKAKILNKMKNNIKKQLKFQFKI